MQNSSPTAMLGDPVLADINSCLFGSSIQGDGEIVAAFHIEEINSVNRKNKEIARGCIYRDSLSINLTRQRSWV